MTEKKQDNLHDTRGIIRQIFEFFHPILSIIAIIGELLFLLCIHYKGSNLEIAQYLPNFISDFILSFSTFESGYIILIIKLIIIFPVFYFLAFLVMELGFVFF